MGQTVGLFLRGVGERAPEARAVAKKALERWGVFWGGDDQDVPDPCDHQSGQRMVDHRLVVDRHQLLADRLGQGPQTRPTAAGKNNSFHNSKIGDPVTQDRPRNPSCRSSPFPGLVPF